MSGICDKLKPCPFCGSYNLIKGNHSPFVICDDCKAFGPGHADLTPDEAVEKWNTRATLGGDDKSRWFELFGTPEKAARTIADACTTDPGDGCIGCPAFGAKCGCGGYDALLEWLKQEVDA